MAEDMWTNIGEAIGGPLKIAGAARQGLYDPYGQQRQMRQQSIDMNSMTMARQRLDDMLELGFQGIQSGTMTMDDVYGAVNIAVEQDPYLKNISAPIAKTYVDYMVKQTQKQQAMADEKAMHEKQQGFFANLSEMKHLNPDVGNQLARNLGEDAGFAFGEGEILAGKDPDWVQVETVGPDGKPVTQFVNRNQIPANATLPKYQSPDNQLFAIPGQPPQAINMNQPGAVPIPTQLPPSATKMGTPSSVSNVSVNPTIINSSMEKSTKGNIERDISDALVTLSGLENSINGFESKFLTIPGKGLAKIQEIGDLWGVPKLLGTEHLNESRAFISGSMNEFLKFRKFITGVAGGIEEFKMIAEAFPNAKVDSPAEWMSKAKQALSNTKRIINLLSMMKNEGLPIDKENVEDYLRRVGGIKNVPEAKSAGNNSTSEKEQEDLSSVPTEDLIKRLIK